MVIDLRDNGGGSEGGAVDLASLFVRKGEVIVTNEYRDHKEVIKRKSKDDIFCDTPLVVIINENSASASELFAGSIQDNDRGVIIGRTSFGKGLIQRIVDLKDGSGITLTIGRYKTPSGRIIQRPYEMGERDTYRSDKTRYMHPDSIEHDEALLFRTLKHHRPIYGGGGITPDIYIESDSVRISECVSKSTADLMFYHAIIDYWDICNPSYILSQYPTIKDFGEGYTIDDELLQIFYKAADYSIEELTPTDIDYIHTTLRSTMAKLLYGEDANRYPFGLSLDYTQQRAIEIASDRTKIEYILGGSF
jgi:carboxyl-terminal processing protease